MRTISRPRTESTPFDAKPRSSAHSPTQEVLANKPHGGLLPESSLSSTIGSDGAQGRGDG